MRLGIGKMRVVSVYRVLGIGKDAEFTLLKSGASGAGPHGERGKEKRGEGENWHWRYR